MFNVVYYGKIDINRQVQLISCIKNPLIEQREHINWNGGNLHEEHKKTNVYSDNVYSYIWSGSNS